MIFFYLFAPEKCLQMSVEAQPLQSSAVISTSHTLRAAQGMAKGKIPAR